MSLAARSFSQPISSAGVWRVAVLTSVQWREREEPEPSEFLENKARDTHRSGPSMRWSSDTHSHVHTHPHTHATRTLISISGSFTLRRRSPIFSPITTGTTGLRSGFKVDLTPPYFLDMGDMGDPPKSKLLNSFGYAYDKMMMHVFGDYVLLCGLWKKKA